MTLIKEICLDEVKEHSNNESVWIIINNNVYDVTAYLNEHPGGEEVLLEYAGLDGSEAFEDASHSSDAKELMIKYKIGTLPVSERKNVGKTYRKSNKSTIKSSLHFWLSPIAIALVVTVVWRVYTYSKISS